MYTEWKYSLTFTWGAIQEIQNLLEMNTVFPQYWIMWIQRHRKPVKLNILMPVSQAFRLTYWKGYFSFKIKLLISPYLHDTSPEVEWVHWMPFNIILKDRKVFQVFFFFLVNIFSNYLKTPCSQKFLRNIPQSSVCSNRKHMNTCSNLHLCQMNKSSNHPNQPMIISTLSKKSQLKIGGTAVATLWQFFQLMQTQSA